MGTLVIETGRLDATECVRCTIHKQEQILGEFEEGFLIIE